MLLHGSSSARRRGPGKRALQHGPAYAWSKRAIDDRKDASVAPERQSKWPIRGALRRRGASEPSVDSGASLHEDLWIDRRATRDGRGGPARMGGAQSASAAQGSHNRRTGARRENDLLSAAPAAVLRRHGRRRRARAREGRSRGGSPPASG